ncbi:hypothetical protein KM043_001668 [Ampulex compressa]|nr:hypothetical protein KM043_001668 [Ampulex compressa]
MTGEEGRRARWEKGDNAGRDKRAKQMRWMEASARMVSIVFPGKFRRTMERVDLALMNVYYISTLATLGFEVTSFPDLRHPPLLPTRLSPFPNHRAASADSFADSNGPGSVTFFSRVDRGLWNLDGTIFSSFNTPPIIHGDVK